MATETERKFLVVGDGYKSSPKIYLHQGYLCTDPNNTVRVRIAGEKAFLTIKGKNKGISRAEFEYTIPISDAQELLRMANGKTIEKYRYHFKTDTHLWEIDEFLGENKGLIVAEIELSDSNEAFDKPIWIGEEVSNDIRYYNSNLCQHPYSTWEKEK